MTTAIQGKYGFYPATYAQYRKLKRLSFLAYESRRRNAAWWRWARKDPQNRLLYRYEKFGDYTAKIPVGPAPEPERSDLPASLYDQIAEDYRRARYPVATAAEVKPLTMSEEVVENLSTKLEAWYATKAELVAA